jgi:quercetin dioxygenase-like cupin family protein
MTYKISPMFLVFIAHFASVGVFAQSPGRSGGFYELQSAPVADSHVLEATMGVIQREGISSSSKHYHPGGEFGYVIEGSITA